MILNRTLVREYMNKKKENNEKVDTFAPLVILCQCII